MNNTPSYFKSNERVQELMIQLQEAVRDQHGHDAVIGSIHQFMVRHKDGQISMLIINNVPVPTWQCTLNVVAILKDFTTWLHDVVVHAHDHEVEGPGHATI